MGAYPVVVARNANDPMHDDPHVDLDRLAVPDDPPVPGAQWDEVHGRWEIWDEDAQAWFILTASGRERRPPVEAIPSFLAREANRDDEIEDDVVHIIDVDRIVAPSQPVPGAQWNEVVGRWERWDDAAGAWVEAHANASAS